MPGAVRADAEFSKYVSLAEDELAVAEEACKFGRFAAADESLNRVESALDVLRKARFAREQAERNAKEEAERVAREKAEAELKAKKEGGPSRTGEPQGGGGLQSAVGANGGLEAAAPLAGTRTVVRVGSQEIALRWCPPGSFLKTQREGPVRLALRLADRGAVGIRLPGGDDRRRDRSDRCFFGLVPCRPRGLAVQPRPLLPFGRPRRPRAARRW